MQQIARAAHAAMDARIAAGLDINGNPARPLTARYADRKRALGARPIRDLALTHYTRNSIGIQASDGHALIAPTNSVAALRIRLASRFSQQFGLSASERAVFLSGYQALFNG